MSLLRKPFRSVSRKSPPLALVIFWNVFTSIHAAVMLHGLWGNPVIVFLLLFYAVFFAVGIFMARAWWVARVAQHHFGNPQLRAMPDVLAGQSVRLAVEFDKVFATSELLVATLQWVRRDARGAQADIPAQTALQTTVQGSLMNGVTGMIWEAQVTVPAPPDAFVLSRPELVLELHPAASTLQGWRFSVPVSLKQGAPMALTQTQARQVQSVLSVIAGVMALAGAGLLFSALRSSHFSFFRLAFPFGIFCGAYLAWTARGLVLQQSSINEAGRPGAQGGAAFIKRAGRLARVFAVCAVLAFVLDLFSLADPAALPDIGLLRELRAFLGK